MTGGATAAPRDRDRVASAASGIPSLGRRSRASRRTRPRPRAGDREQEPLAPCEIETGSGTGLDPEGNEARDDHERAPDRRGRGDRESTARVEDGRRDRAVRVEQHLRHEEPQQIGRQLALLRGDVRVFVAGRQRARQRGCEHDAEHNDRSESDEGHTQQATGEPFGLLLVVAVEEVDERRHEHRGQRTGGQQLEENVRDGVRRLERVAQKRCAQHRSDDEHAEKSERPGNRGSHAHVDRSAAHRAGTRHGPLQAGRAWSAPLP